MSKLPVISPGDLEKLLLYLGFYRKRQRGSHVFYQHPDGRATVFPFHSGEDIGRGLLRKILRDIGIEPEEYIHLRKEVL
jgi:predicted RNA binding protein YcfA (HicA-like mRNA interferase family)